MQHLDENNILTDYQYGFNKNRSCESQLALTAHDLAKELDDKERNDMIFLDFSKAFDKVPYERLKYKLSHYGIRGNTLSWIEPNMSTLTAVRLKALPWCQASLKVVCLAYSYQRPSIIRTKLLPYTQGFTLAVALLRVSCPSRDLF